ncbi:hypothetical protein CHLNCDRAFT_134908 [Chlorella variabilis]|uniref:Uncharacterized protein n=1 Tax=Chlorella variabilis TaxID=554065 RepID=E1ZH33_CHLVA|nr:hypothetical protein CHLNCDRAFT_134908 [Chlorella variabilis]EFN54853.1 hypothetical protein CHLNCDRAFT_134908 [Chlorella variabilis]|eukprot:XP_005846955.1 hypothetical protein CHLNCDRAFT_134908 [Chlorella variabilis]
MSSAGAAGGGAGAPAGATSFLTLTYADNEQFHWDLNSNSDASLLNFTSLELYYEEGETSFSSLLTLATDFLEPFGTFNFTDVNDALTALGLEPISGNLNETDELWAVLTSPSGALAGRFTDIAVEDELQPTDDVFFLADLQGNDSVDPFTFNVTQDITWPPSLPRNASTQFTLSVVDTEDGNFLYNIFLTDNLNTSESVSLVFVKDDAIETAITLNDFIWEDASYGGSQGIFSKQALLDSLESQGQLDATELFPLIILSSNETTTYGISGHFDPVWKL